MRIVREFYLIALTTTEFLHQIRELRVYCVYEIEFIYTLSPFSQSSMKSERLDVLRKDSWTNLGG